MFVRRFVHRSINLQNVTTCSSAAAVPEGRSVLLLMLKVSPHNTVHLCLLQKTHTILLHLLKKNTVLLYLLLNNPRYISIYYKKPLQCISIYYKSPSHDSFSVVFFLNIFQNPLPQRNHPSPCLAPLHPPGLRTPSLLPRRLPRVRADTTWVTAPSRTPSPPPSGRALQSTDYWVTSDPCATT